MFKRLIDIFLSLIALVFLSPFLLVISFLIKLDSRGSILFSQVRIGKNLKRFKIFKFRTMYQDQSSHGDIVNNKDLSKARSEYKTTEKNDPRITKIGEFLRKYSIDELPQIFNIIIGDMSVVGPRPDVPAQEADYSNRQWVKRHAVKPGLTGLAQINSRNKKFDHNLRIALDIWYTKKNNFCLDILIILRTFKLVFRGRDY
tara:strand:- start:3196 stop:3798 length:603 start_codon:yes stop_codon:yes gene_type:complete